MSPMPIRICLKELCSSEYFTVVERAADELNSDREILRREAGRHAHRRQSTEVADTAERIRERQIGLEVRLHRCGGDRKRRRGNQVVLVEKRVHLLRDD